MTFKTKWFGGLVAVALATGCGTAVDEVDTELCEHLAEGPSAPVIAVASGDASGAAVSDDHRRYDITLASGAGKVSFAVDHAGEYVFGVGANVPMAITTPDGATVSLESQRTTDLACTELKNRIGADLGTIGTYTLTFGPSSTQTVQLVIEHAHSDHTHG